MAKVVPEGNKPGKFTFWCSACGYYHWFKIEGAGPCWTWNGDTEKPTIQPSIRVRAGDGHCCHMLIRDGQIEYCADSTHEMAGQTVEMEDCDW